MSGRSLMLSFVLLLTLPVPAQATAAGAAEFRGYMAANQLLRERVFEEGSEFQLGQYVGQSYHPMQTNLLDLLGTYKTGFGGGFRNGKPNALNMLLWHLLLSEFSNDVAKACKGNSELDLNDAFLARLKGLCESTTGLRASQDVLFDYWLALMGHDAPVSEFREWERFVSTAPMSDLRGAEAVEQATLSILNSSYFLLKH